MSLNLTHIVIAAMVCVAQVECVALILGHNGTVLASVTGAFCLIIGAVAIKIRESTKKS